MGFKSSDKTKMDSREVERKELKKQKFKKDKTILTSSLLSTNAKTHCVAKRESGIENINSIARNPMLSLVLQVYCNCI